MTTRRSLLCLGGVLVLALNSLSGLRLPPGGWQDQSAAATPSPSSNIGSGKGAGSHAKNLDIPPFPSAVQGATDSELQARIQKALGNDPTLNSDQLTVVVSASAIDLSGSVASGRDRLAATRIARSYAGSKRLVNHLWVRETAPFEARPPEREPPR